MIGRLALAGAALTLAVAAAPETYVWKPVAIGAGGFITGLAGDPTGATEVIRTDTYGAYRWDAAAKRWRQLVRAPALPAADRRQSAMNEGVYEIAVAPSDPRRLYMAIKGFVYRSDDGGDHWRHGPADGPFPARFDPNSEYRHYGPFMAVDPRNPDVLFVGLPEDGLWRSTDGGGHWTKPVGVPPPADQHLDQPGQQAPGPLIWFERAAGGAVTGRVWAMSPGHGVFVSADGGASFAALPSATAPVPRLLKHGVFAPDGSFFAVDVPGRAVWRYRAGAWTDLAGSPTLPRREYAALAVLRAGVVVMDNGGVTLRSGDGGEHWQALPRHARVGPGDPPWLHVADQDYFATADLRPDPRDPDRLFVAAGTGLFDARIPAGATRFDFVSRSRGIEQLVTNDVVAPPGGAPLFAAWDFGIHRRTDLDHYSTTYGPKERVLIAAQQVDWSAGDPRFLVTNASDTRVGCCSEDGEAVLAGYSRDGGVTWSRFPTLPQPPGTAADDPWRMSFGTIAVAAGDTADIAWAPAADHQPFVTRDRGATWQPVVLPGAVGPNTGSFAHYSLDRKTLAADRVLPRTFYLVHSGGGANAAVAGLWRSDDGGTTWTRAFAGEIAPMSGGPAKLRAVPGHAGHLFFTAAADAADAGLRRSRDGGTTWSVVVGVDHVDDVGFGKAAAGAAYPTIFVSGRVGGVYGIWRSTDDAATWHRLAAFPLGTLDQVQVIEGDKDVFGRVYVGYQGSSWIYGQPGACLASGAQCVAVDAPGDGG
ncbi:MAG: hypothetical protein JO290_06015 [Sphingomonadaceae bacterium]|nr:hypothetical protein [Sphingomonadaceae bacterium]